MIEIGIEAASWSVIILMIVLFVIKCFIYFSNNKEVDKLSSVLIDGDISIEYDSVKTKVDNAIKTAEEEEKLQKEKIEKLKNIVKK